MHGIIEKLGGMFFVIFGAAFTIFSKSMAHYAVNAWARRCNVTFGKWGYQAYRFGFLLAGMGSIIFGTLKLLGVI